VADDGSAANPFEEVSDRIASLIMSAYEIEKSYLREIGSIGATQEAIRAGLEAGSLLTLYVGHGNITSWASENLLTVEDATALTNGDRVPIVIALNCLNGYFMDVEAPRSLAEALVGNRSGGAAGVWAPAGLGYLLDEEAFARAWVEEVFTGGERTMGNAIVRAKARHAIYNGLGSNRELLESYTWFGDPAIEIALPAPRTLQPPLVRATTQGVWLRWAAPPPPVARVHVLRGFSSGREDV
jgi:hypothetical protein